MPLGAMLVKKIGASGTLLIGGLVFSSAVFLSSFAKTLFSFLLCYSFLIGSGIGIAYTAPMTAGWKWMPKSKGLISGAILTGFGMGGFIFNLIGTKLVNPKGFDSVDGK
jgi:MFS family permease